MTIRELDSHDKIAAAENTNLSDITSLNFSGRFDEGNEQTLINYTSGAGICLGGHATKGSYNSGDEIRIYIDGIQEASYPLLDSAGVAHVDIPPCTFESSFKVTVYGSGANTNVQTSAHTYIKPE